MNKGIARRTGTGLTGRKTTAQTPELRTPISPGRQPAEVDCPVCTYPARRYDDRTDASLYIHEYRAFPCRSPEQVLTVTEFIDAVPPIRFGV